MCKKRKTRNSFPASHVQASVQWCPGEQGSIRRSGDLAWQIPSLWMSPPPPPCPSFVHWAWCHMEWDIPWSAGVGCPLSLVPSPLAGGARWEAEKALTVGTAQQWLEHPCVINTVSSSNAKHRHILAIGKQINYVPLKTSMDSSQDCTQPWIWPASLQPRNFHDLSLFTHRLQWRICEPRRVRLVVGYRASGEWGLPLIS